MSDQDRYAEGYAASQEHDRANLAAVLRGLMANPVEGDEPLSATAAREIMTAVCGLEVAEAEFGSDPKVDAVLRQMFPE